MRPPLDELVHCLVITYNRAESLRATLAGLAASPFREARITVLDNASTDDTPAVTREFASRFPRYEVVRHRYNIGGSGNLLRALELSRAPYTWVLADDDQINNADISDVHEVMAAGSADAISLSFHLRSERTAGKFYDYWGTVREGFSFFGPLLFVTNTIFRTSLIDSGVIHQGYLMAGTLLPHFGLVTKIALSGGKLYCCREPIVERLDRDAPWTNAFFWNAWAECCSRIPDPAVRAQALKELLNNKKPVWLVLPKIILQLHAREEGDTRNFIRSVRFLPPSAQVATLLACAACVIPPRTLRLFLKPIYRLAGRPYDFLPKRKIPVDPFRF